jgi:hypothetical protein
LLTNNVARAAKYIALLALFLAAVSVAAGIVAARRYGNAAYLSSAVAAFLVWLAGAIALAIVAVSKSPYQRLNAVLLAMLVRMALPILAGVFLAQSISTLAAAGFAGLVVVHYLAGLALETWMSVRLAGATTATAHLGPNGTALTR